MLKVPQQIKLTEKINSRIRENSQKREQKFALFVISKFVPKASEAYKNHLLRRYYLEYAEQCAK